MNILNKITLKEIKTNKKRFISSVTAVSLAIALFLIIGIVFSTIYKNQLDQTLNETGDYHLVLNNFRYDELDVVQETGDIKNIRLFKTLNEGSDSITYSVVGVYAVDDLTLSSLNLLDGFLPQSNDEIMISSTFQTYSNLKTNDNLMVQSEEGTTRYQVVGIYEDTVGLLGSVDTQYQFLTSADFNSADYISAVITYNQIDKTIYTNGNYFSSNLTFAEKSSIYKTYVSYNESLLGLHGVAEGKSLAAIGMVIFLLMIIMTVVGIVTFFIIYNSYLISIAERKKNIGILKSIGSTPKQIIKNIFFESFIIYIISLIIGFIGATIFSYFYFNYINTELNNIITYQFQISINPLFLLVSIIFTLLTVIMATLSAALRATEISPIDLIRQTETIKNKKIRKYPWFLKLFGVEGQYAYMNMKRNKDKFKTSLTSMVISIVLFITFVTIVSFFATVLNNNNPYYQSYIEISTTKDYQLLDDIKNIKYIDEIFAYSSSTLYLTELDSYYTSEYLDNYINKNRTEDKTHDGYSVIVFSDTDFEFLENKYDLPDSDIYISNQFYYRIMEDETEIGTVFNSSVLKEIVLCQDTVLYSSTGSQRVEGSCDKKITDIPVIDNVFYLETLNYSPTIIVKESYFDKLSNYYGNVIFDEDVSIEQRKQITTIIENSGININIRTREYLKFDKAIKELFAENNLDISNQNDFYYYNLLAESEAEIRTYNTITSAIYIFLFYVGMIAVLSIYNTIFASNELRKREFAILRSIGMERKGFIKISILESIILSLKSLIFAIPAIYIIINLIFKIFNFQVNITGDDNYGFALVHPPYRYMIYCFLAVFAIVLVTNLLATRKIQKQDMISLIK
ncbi:MAG: FtsX-like permease family protein [Bacilli bacterium]|nr:FtsX-like permease family protein [Bacilli bacterium]